MVMQYPCNVVTIAASDNHYLIWSIAEDSGKLALAGGGEGRGEEYCSRFVCLITSMCIIVM